MRVMHRSWLFTLAAILSLSACDEDSFLVTDGSHHFVPGEGDEGSSDISGSEPDDGTAGDEFGTEGDEFGGGTEGDGPGEEATCEDLCRAGEKQCSVVGEVQVCRDIDGDGCLEWSVSPCPDGTHCLNGVCQGDEEEVCTDACHANGARECVAHEDGGAGYRICSNFNDDVCLEWSSPIACANGDACVDGKCGCVDDCASQGETECHDGGVRTCADIDGDGCLEWSSVTHCEDICRDGKCVCNHACELGARQCSGVGYVTCVTDGSGCRRWSGVTDCAHGCEGGDCKAAPVVMAATRYPGERMLSPVTPYVVERMKAIRAKNNSRKDTRFIKVGDSHMYSDSVFMYCYSKTGAKGGMNLSDATHLQGAIDYFQSESDAFHRDSLTAVMGKTMWWSLSGGYLTQEIDAMNPRFAFVGYGSNDMGWYGYTKFKGEHAGYFASLEWYYSQMLQASEQLINGGIIPMFIGTGIRTDQSKLEEKNKPRHYVSMFNAVARGLAEKYQVPYYNLQLSQESLPSYGLSGDGLHHKHVDKGCTFTASGLSGGANTRNRYALEMLDRAWRTVIRGEAAPDQEVFAFDGKGSRSEPWLITSLPYTHTGNTKDGESHFDAYGCLSGTSEAGPELYYRLELAHKTKVRAFALSSSGVDVDIHLKKSLNDNACLVRGDKWFEGNLDAGTYYIVVDTFKSSSKAGEYLLGVLACDADDASCGSALVGE